MNLTIAIIRHAPDAIFVIKDNDYKTLDWDAANAASKPTLAALQAAWDAGPTANEYTFNRKQFRAWRRKVTRGTGFNTLLETMLATDNPAFDDIDAMLDGDRFQFLALIKLMEGFEDEVIELNPDFSVAQFQAVAAPIWVEVAMNKLLASNA